MRGCSYPDVRIKLKQLIHQHPGSPPHRDPARWGQMFTVCAHIADLIVGLPRRWISLHSVCSTTVLLYGLLTRWYYWLRRCRRHERSVLYCCTLLIARRQCTTVEPKWFFILLNSSALRLGYFRQCITNTVMCCLLLRLMRKLTKVYS